MLKYFFLAALLPFSIGTSASQVEDQDFALDLDDDGLPDFLDLDADGDGAPNGEDPEPLNPSA